MLRLLEYLMPLLGLCVLGRVSKRTSDVEWSRPVLMTQTSWFARLVQKHQLQEWLVNRRDEKDRAAVTGQCECEILVEVGDGRVYDGPLTPWNEEENLLWEHLGRPCAARSLNIRQQHCAAAPRACATAFAAEGTNLESFSPGIKCAGPWCRASGRRRMFRCSRRLQCLECFS